MRTFRQCFRPLTSFLTLTIVLTFTILGYADEDLRVLPVESKAGPTKHQLTRHLKQRARVAFDRRRAAYEKLETPELIETYQAQMRKTFVEHLGGFPERTPLNAETVGKIKGDGYRIEKIIFESQSRHFVTAVLFLPEAKPPFPGVVLPCGHSRSGKAAQQRMCILLAGNGIAALSYDPIGQAERAQLLDANNKPRFKMTTEHNIVGISSIPLGRNTATFRIWDGMRAIDYLAGRKEVDATKIGVTGCSGGGTLTSYLMALDDRVACAAPSCYITSFQRLLDTIGTGDAEQNIHGQFAYGMDHADYMMMRAPKPTLILASTRDFFDIDGTWDSFRQAKRFYTRLGFAERMDIVETDARHGYPKFQREAMARWMRRFLLGVDEPITEPEFQTHSASALQCSPKGQVMLIDGARSVIDLNADFAARLADERRGLWKPENRRQTLAKVRRIAGIGELSELPPAKIRNSATIQRNGYQIKKLVLGTEQEIELPALWFVPQKPNGQRYLYLHGEGKHKDATVDGPIEKIVGVGNHVLAVDLRGMGEMSASGEDAEVAYMLHKSLVGMRAEDALVTARFLSTWEREGKPSQVHLIASGAAQSPAIHAAALESQLFASLQLIDPSPSWSEIVSDPTRGKLTDLIHGALRVYDLPDLVAAYRSMKENQ